MRPPRSVSSNESVSANAPSLGRTAYRSVPIACQLIDRGWRRTTPAAIIVDATRPEQQVWRGTLDHLAEDAVTIDGFGAGTIVIGDVVAIGLQQEIDIARAYVSSR